MFVMDTTAPLLRNLGERCFNGGEGYFLCSCKNLFLFCPGESYYDRRRGIDAKPTIRGKVKLMAVQDIGILNETLFEITVSFINQKTLRRPSR